MYSRELETKRTVFFIVILFYLKMFGFRFGDMDFSNPQGEMVNPKHPRGRIQGLQTLIVTDRSGH